MLRIIKLIIQSMLVAYLVIFSVSNVETVTFKPFMNIAQYNIPLFLLVIITLFIGMIIGALALYGEKLLQNQKIKNLNKEIKANQQEIERLQKLTISQEPETKNTTISEDTAQNDIKDVLR